MEKHLKSIARSSEGIYNTYVVVNNLEKSGMIGFAIFKLSNKMFGNNKNTEKI